MAGETDTTTSPLLSDKDLHLMLTFSIKNVIALFTQSNGKGEIFLIFTHIAHMYI